MIYIRAQQILVKKRTCLCIGWESSSLGRKHTRTSVLFLFVLVIVIENPDGKIHDETDHTKVLC
jgi:hypothetical protein